MMQNRVQKNIRQKNIKRVEGIYSAFKIKK